MKFFNGAITSINAAALLIGAAGLLSRILGVLRDRLLAAHFGASRELDIYYAAFQLPDFLYTIFLIGAASAAIIPLLAELCIDDVEKAKSLIRELSGIFFAASVGIAGVAFILAPVLMRFIAPGFSDEERMLGAALTRIMLLSPVFLGFSNIISSVIQSFRRFFIFALSSILYNLGIIAGIVFFLPLFGLPGLAGGVILGALLHAAIGLPTFYMLGFRLDLKPRFSLSPSARKVLSLSLPRITALSLTSFTSIVLVAISSTLLAGSIAVYQFANNLYYLPVGLFGVSFSTAAFPVLAESFYRKDHKGFSAAFYGTIRSVLFWVLPISSLFFVLRAQIVRVALGAGRFDWTDTRLTAASLGIFALAIIAASLAPILIKSFYAMGNTKLPLLINMGTALFTIGSALVFLYVLKNNEGIAVVFARLLKVSDLHDISILAISAAASIGSILDTILLFYILRKETEKKLGSGFEEKGGKAVMLMAVVALFAGLFGFGALRVMNELVTLDTFWGVFIQGAVSFSLGIFFYWLVLLLLGNKEVGTLFIAIKKRMFTLRVLPIELDGERGN